MGTTQVKANTNPEEIKRRRLNSGGPMGFVMAVHDTLRRIGRPYYYARAVPKWLGARRSDDQQVDRDFSEVYKQFQSEQQRERDITQTDHCIIHQWRKYPSRLRMAGASDSAGGTRRQVSPNGAMYHNRPLPTPAEDKEHRDKQRDRGQARPAIQGGHKRPPLWDSKDQVPDIIRDMVDEDTTVYVTPWNYDVFVDFVMVAANMWLLHQMEEDLMMILRTFHDRWATGASNIAGHFHQSVPGAPSPIDSKLPDHMPSHTITWRLQQTEADAFPVRQLEEIHLGLHGDASKIATIS